MAAPKKRRYEYKITLGRDLNGALIRKSFYSTKSRSDGKKKAEEFKLQHEMVKFSDWAHSCLTMYKKPYVKANTYYGTYLEPLEKHLIPYFGHMNLDSIRPVHVQNYINQAAEKYAPETLKKDYNILNLIFQTAMDNQLCSKSPMTKSIKLPKYEVRAKKQAYTQEQYDIAYNFASKWPNGLSIMLLLETGISRSELLGLRWEDLDLSTRCRTRASR